jgi:hypothetical protein
MKKSEICLFLSIYIRDIQLIAPHCPQDNAEFLGMAGKGLPQPSVLHLPAEPIGIPPHSEHPQLSLSLKPFTALPGEILSPLPGPDELHLLYEAFLSPSSTTLPAAVLVALVKHHLQSPLHSVSLLSWGGDNCMRWGQLHEVV